MGNFTGKEGVEGDQKAQPGNYGIDQGSRTEPGRPGGFQFEYQRPDESAGGDGMDVDAQRFDDAAGTSGAPLHDRPKPSTPPSLLPLPLSTAATAHLDPATARRGGARADGVQMGARRQTSVYHGHVQQLGEAGMPARFIGTHRLLDPTPSPLPARR
mmetsp:Transcript_23723/g.63801  ORF Transcript_23723/g.63801 Transcript_23723/m.63801 type:complete len:157 (-) Transcript_23723:546-1016(-)